MTTTTTPAPTPAPTGDKVSAYQDAGGVHTYYEVQGDGPPVVLLHGGLCTAETWGAEVPALAERYTVYVPERRGHGRTPDVDGPITYEVMTADTIAFMDALGVARAHLVGWSDGAIVGLLVALERPDLVAKLVMIGQNLDLDGYAPHFREMLDSGTLLAEPPPMLRDMYAAVSPDGPEHFDVVFGKLADLYKVAPDLDLDVLAEVAAPTLVLCGDDDIISVEHAADVVRRIPDAQLGVVPGTSHALPLEKPGVVNQLVLDFLADEQAPKFMGTDG
ncbi:MAG: alpha/beta hydrolase [Acidimicrobiia bacterium]